MHERPVLIIALAQLLGTSLWFSANSAAPDLMRDWGATLADIGWLTDAVQLGFIVGTMAVALLGVGDRHRASHIFAVCAVTGAVANACFAWFSTALPSAAVFRFIVGMSLAGVYPLGMKLIVGWAPSRAGSALALLVGMLVLGTALPQLMRVLGADLPWREIMLGSSALALVAAVLILLMGDGPHHAARKPQAGVRRANVFSVFRLPDFRASALGYFGHMWEVYAFWTLVPALITQAHLDVRLPGMSVAGLSFAVIAAGAPGCWVGGAFSKRIGSARVAALALGVSGVCCVVAALFGEHMGPWTLLGFFLVWGVAVAADSPQFSAMSAEACPPAMLGSAFAVQNSIGFAITLLAIALTTRLFHPLGWQVAWLLAPGPVLGVLAARPLWRRPLGVAMSGQ